MRKRAKAENKSMGQLASERLVLALGEEDIGVSALLSWPRLRMGAPRVDLRDKDALWRLLDGAQSESSH